MSYETYLAHHGVKGMRWGVRRYQNSDGSLTSAGRNRYGYDKRIGLSEERKHKMAKGLKIGASLAVATAAAYAAYKTNPELLTKTLSKGSKFIADHKDVVVSNLKDRAKQAVVSAGNSLVDAAIASAGTIAISKLSKELEAKEGDSDRQKMAKKVALDISVAGVKGLTKGSKSNNGNGKGNKNKNGKNNDADISKAKEKIGEPKGGPIDKSGKEYQSLFKDSSGNTRSPEERATIKALASKGYSIEQIRQYLSHSSFNSKWEGHLYSSFYPDELYHHGIKGMRWGVRRYQNPDGSLKNPTSNGDRKTALKKEYKDAKKSYKEAYKYYDRGRRNLIGGVSDMIGGKNEITKTVGFYRGVIGYGGLKAAKSKEFKERQDRYIRAKSMYKGVSEDKIRNNIKRVEAVKTASAILLEVGALKLSSDPKAQQAVGNAIGKTINVGAKYAQKAATAYFEWSLGLMKGR